MFYIASHRLSRRAPRLVVRKVNSRLNTMLNKQKEVATMNSPERGEQLAREFFYRV